MTPQKTEIHTELIAPEGSGPFPTIMVLTGDGPDGSGSDTYSSLAQDLKALGIATFLFDFRGLGQSRRAGDSRDLGIAIGVADFRRAHDLMAQRTQVDMERIGLFASSFGAAVALGATDLVNQYKSVVFKSPAASLADAYLHNLTSEEFERWKKEGYSSKFQRRFGVLADALAHAGYMAARDIAVPTLTIHGMDDDVVPTTQAQALYTILEQHSPDVRHRLELAEGVKHRFNKTQWEEARNGVVAFIAGTLSAPERATHEERRADAKKPGRSRS